MAGVCPPRRADTQCDALGETWRDAAATGLPAAQGRGHRPRLRDRRYAAGQTGSPARAALRRRLGRAAGPGRSRISGLDLVAGSRRRHARSPCRADEWLHMTSTHGALRARRRIKLTIGTYLL